MYWGVCFHTSLRGVSCIEEYFLVMFMSILLIFLVKTWCKQWVIVCMLDSKVCKGVVILCI